VGLAEADIAEQDGVGFLFDELQAKEVLQLRPVDFLRPAPVELIEGFSTGKRARRMRRASPESSRRLTSPSTSRCR